MKAKYNTLYNFMVEHEWESLLTMTLAEIWRSVWINHVQKVKNWLNYLTRHSYLSFKPWLIIQTHDWIACQEFINNISELVSEYKKMHKALQYLKILPNIN